MRRSFIAGFLACTFLLTSCQPQSAGEAVQADAVGHFFEVTATSSVEKGSAEEAQAHAVVTATKHSSYPTPLATYLVPSNLSTYTNPSEATNTPTVVLPTATALQPTATSVVTTAAPTNISATATLIRTNTAQPSVTSTPVTPTFVPSSVPSTATPIPYSFAIQSGTPIQTQNFANSSGCAWQGIAGQVFDTNGNPLKNIVVKAGGTWNGATVNILGMTGIATGYGEGGYELVLGSKVVASTNTVWVQILDLSGNPISQKVNISTSTDCTKNLVLLNFKQIDDGYTSYLPMVLQTSVP